MHQHVGSTASSCSFNTWLTRRHLGAHIRRHAQFLPLLSPVLQPLVSARNALYDMLWDEAALKSALGYGRADIMQDDNHPAFIGELLKVGMGSPGVFGHLCQV
jgi:hypothetical protein